MDVLNFVQNATLLLAIAALVFLSVAEVLAPFSGKANLTINKKRLYQVSSILGIAFLTIVVARMVLLF